MDSLLDTIPLAEKAVDFAPPEPLRLPVHVLNFRAGETVIAAGERKRFVFRVEHGRITLTWPITSGAGHRQDSIGPFTIFGLGFLNEHICDAVADVDSVVSCWSRSALSVLQDCDPDVEQRACHEAEREFDYRRSALAPETPLEPYRQVAGFLCVASSMNASEGRNPSVVDETIDCAYIAELLKIDIDALGRALLKLRKLGLIEPHEQHSVRICDPDALAVLFENGELTERYGIGGDT